MVGLVYIQFTVTAYSLWWAVVVNEISIEQAWRQVSSKRLFVTHVLAVYFAMAEDNAQKVQQAINLQLLLIASTCIWRGP